MTNHIYVAACDRNGGIYHYTQNPDGSLVLVVANPYTDEMVVSFGGKSYALPPRSINTITE